MTGRLPLLLTLLALCTPLRAQVFFYNDNLTGGRMSDIKTTVVDSLTQEPIPFASVYVVPAKDTTITNFTLTDAQGAAKLDEVPYGNYVFHVEMMGYKPYVKERYFREEEVDLGTIRLKPDEYFLQAATVSDIGNPIVIKKDTVEFNAASFRVGANAMLKDLLMRMPGMEITEDGKVKFNGEEIDKLTVGGRTFFFGDQSAALNNLPAAVVDKIRVIDRASEEERDTGIQTSAREKVLDVGLKKEYEKGWFGNIGLKGGTALARKDGAILRDERGLLFADNLLVSAYTEKDQLTVIGNAQNVDESGLTVTFMDESGEVSTMGGGLSTAYQAGLNLNTSRIKDVETTVSASYTFSDTDSGTKTARTTSQEGGDLLTDDERTGKQFVDKFSSDLEFKKEKGKFWFTVQPSFTWQRSDATQTGQTETHRGGERINRTESNVHSLQTNKDASVRARMSFRELGGKAKRSLRLTMLGSYGKNVGASDEVTDVLLADNAAKRTLHYDLDAMTSALNGNISYTEPLGAKWTLTADASGSLRRENRVRNASDALGQNDYLSSAADTRTLVQEYALRSQYNFGEESWIQFGAQSQGILRESRAKSFGNETVTGLGEWDWFVRPSVELEHSWGIHRINFEIFNSTTRPAGARILPTLNISDPARLSMGNIYLKPSSYTYVDFTWRRNDRERFSTLMVDLSGSIRTQSIVDAQWYDADGIMYRIPVNARKPALDGWFYVNYTTPLNAKKTWSLSLQSYLNITSSASYLARGAVVSPSRDAFDYAAFMEDFWGNAAGDRFYAGRSGFQEYMTTVLAPNVYVRVQLNKEMYSLAFYASAYGNIARYSPKLDLDRNTLDANMGMRGSYTTKHEFEFESELSYGFFKGYASGYGQPYLQWNASISKNVGAFNLSISAHDILNQTHNLRHTAAANYVEDSYQLTMGRYILLGVKWNFGKMNAAHSMRAQNAAWNMFFQ